MRYGIFFIGILFIISSCGRQEKSVKQPVVAEHRSDTVEQSKPAKTQEQLDAEELGMERADPLKYLRSSATYDFKGNEMTADINVYNSAYFVTYQKVAVTVNFLAKDKSVAHSVQYILPEAVKPHDSYKNSYTIKDVPGETDRIKVKITGAEAAP